MPEKCSSCRLKIIADALNTQPTQEYELNKILELQRLERLEIKSKKETYIYGICSGILGRQHLLSDGRRSISELFMNGDLIHSSISPRNSEIIALSNCKLICFSEEQLYQLRYSSRNVDTAYKDCISKQNCMLSEHCSDISKKTPSERIASFLIEYANRKLGEKENEKELVISLLGKDIGEYLALETETVSRSYAKLEEIGAIKIIKAGTIFINNRKELQQIADGGMPRKKKLEKLTK